GAETMVIVSLPALQALMEGRKPPVWLQRQIEQALQSDHSPNQTRGTLDLIGGKFVFTPPSPSGEQRGGAGHAR
ncbi:hypothetical protein D6833_00035, partial [Candidatus Parcubacteria bacterium]